MSFDVLKADLRGVILTKEHGIFLHDIAKTYSSYYGCSLNYEKFGYSNIASLIEDVPDVARICQENGKTVVRGIALNKNNIKANKSALYTLDQAGIVNTNQNNNKNKFIKNKNNLNNVNIKRYNKNDTNNKVSSGSKNIRNVNKEEISCKESFDIRNKGKEDWNDNYQCDYYEGPTFGIGLNDLNITDTLAYKNSNEKHKHLINNCNKVDRQEKRRNINGADTEAQNVISKNTSHSSKYSLRSKSPSEYFKLVSLLPSSMEKDSIRLMLHELFNNNQHYNSSPHEGYYKRVIIDGQAIEYMMALPDVLQVVITHIESDANFFWAVIVHPEELSNEVVDVESYRDQFTPYNVLKRRSVVYHNSCYCRCWVNYFKKNSSVVQLIDFGETDIVPTDKLITAPPHLWKDPPAAVPCKLMAKNGTINLESLHKPHNCWVALGTDDEQNHILHFNKVVLLKD